jgi:adenylate cyclase
MIDLMMDKTNIKTTVLFSDVAGSSKLYKQLGDQAANAAISQCVAMMSAQVKRHHGVVVKTIGDEVMARFDSAYQACAAGIAIQRKSDDDPDGLNIRIGAAYGAAILKNNDVFGEVVNDAAAVAKMAQAHQFLVSEALAEVVEVEEDIITHSFDKIKMKGGQQTSVIHRVDWEPQDITINATQVIEVGTLQQGLVAPHIDLEVHYKGKMVKEVSVTPKITPFSVGREPKVCSLGVPTTLASRDHFHILHRRGKFIIKDKSTNGTYVKEEGADVIYLRREEMPLRGIGIISMGQPPEEAELVVRFQCATAKAKS